MVVASAFDPDRALDLIARQRIDFLLATPAMLTAMTQARTASARDLSSLRVVVCGGSAAPPQLIRRARAVLGCDVRVGDRQTESRSLIA